MAIRAVTAGGAAAVAALEMPGFGEDHVGAFPVGAEFPMMTGFAECFGASEDEVSFRNVLYLGCLVMLPCEVELIEGCSEIGVAAN